METKIISDELIEAAVNEIVHFLQVNEIVHCNIEYFSTFQDGIAANTFKITYTEK